MLLCKTCLKFPIPDVKGSVDFRTDYVESKNSLAP